ncbi:MULTISPECIES: ribosomal protein S18-alanine N-acetyltransferase [Pelosinus]|uniref:[Ribosomal protein bS18]-alanine N-acetyltransferase n=1 Tax=Pelosinus fermentans B4 TaxID=1149862 RepID=I9B4B3_9FIRM|nr:MULTISPECIES: ribosomal protein S18-alanine N-acetyltransferase [Pelosinus]EIW19972.1 ribosomal-protein-alanine acetyltransferase [Pelosinus fermentans B4]EIW21171.1 ribosomal-protein-alanine acetyltransferase [Pelosinus fermentans A11]OAM95052.1 ribosomal-protein-alanine acetyltransferase [Pelosinus fermentans DSM 17108]SDR22576.1 ribosomal-protein-alanine N-acetyltransferase [Pelosinus fermentans]
MTVMMVRRMNTLDIDGVLAVEQQSFTTPWSREGFVNEMNNELSYYLVMVEAGKIIGYAGMWLIVDEAHVTNVAVLPAYRGKKLGEKLMSALLEHAKNRGAVRMTLEVRASNTVAQGLYSKFGFTSQGRRRNYYTDTKEDALIMWCEKL